jgi:hypothetical protein
MILFLEVCAFPPFRQKKGERMGHGAFWEDEYQASSGIATSCL